MSPPIRFCLFPPNLHFCLSSFAKLLFQAYKLLLPIRKHSTLKYKHQQHISTATTNTPFLQQPSKSIHPTQTLSKMCYASFLRPLGVTRQPLCSQLTHGHACERQEHNSSQKLCFCSLSSWKTYKSKMKEIRLVTLVHATCSVLKVVKDLEHSFCSPLEFILFPP